MNVLGAAPAWWLDVRGALGRLSLPGRSILFLIRSWRGRKSSWSAQGTSTMASIDNILDASSRALAQLEASLRDGEDVSVALSIALGRICATKHLDIQHVVAVTETVYRETCAEMEDHAEEKAVAEQVRS